MGSTDRIDIGTDGPSWPQSTQATVVLSDAASRMERRLVEDWVADHKPDGVDAEIITIPPARRRKPRHRIDPRLEPRLDRGDDPMVLPVRVVWLADAGDHRRSLRWRDFLSLRDPRDPDVVSQYVTQRLAPERVRIVTGVPAHAEALRAEWSDSVEVLGFGEFVARRAWLALERGERHLRGTRYKIPKFVREDIVRSGGFRDGLARIAPEVGRAPDQTIRKGSRYLKEIAASHSPFVIDLVASAIRVLYRQGYRNIHYDAAQFQELYTLGAQYPLVFLPSHKSNLDHLVLQYLLWENNLPPNHTAGGINMNFFPVGPLIRRTGVFFIRRSFKDNPTYKFVLKSYIGYLIEKRFPLEWYIEGGRSRSGKLLPPRYGMLVYVADALREGKSDDVYLIPTSIAYDHIQEVGTYAAEQRGEAKQRESATWLVKTVRSLRKRYGNIHLRFGEPLSLSKELDLTLPAEERYLDLQKVAFEVAVRINRVTPITPTSLVTVALLANTHHSLAVPEIQEILDDLIEEVAVRNLPTTEPLAMLRTDAGVLDTLKVLSEHGIVSAFSGGSETVYRIVHDQHLAAAFYRNTIIHFFVNISIAELALLTAARAAERRLDAFWEEVARLRDLFKFEFFFPEREEFREEIHQSLSLYDPAWEDRVRSGGAAVDDFIEGIRPVHAPWVLRSFIESYAIVAEALHLDPVDGQWDEKAFTQQALDLGRQFQLQGRVRAEESVAKSLVATAIRLAENRALIDESDLDVGGRRRAFAEQVADVIDRLDALEGLQAPPRPLPTDGA